MNAVIRFGLLLVCLAGCQKTEPAANKSEPATTELPSVMVKVAAASDLKFALEEVITEFQREHSQIRVEATYGSSGNFFAQLSNQAPFDLFLSADIDYPRKLIAQRQAVAESEFSYAVGQIVVWVPNDSVLNVEQQGAKVLTEKAVQKIAIANPKHAPYGRAAEAALKHLCVYDELADRLVLGENIAQTAQFIESGAADAGIIALSLALAPAMKDKGRYWAVPLDAYPPLEQGGVILNWAGDRAACDQLRAFLMSESGRTILRRYGFLLPGE